MSLQPSMISPGNFGLARGMQPVREIKPRTGRTSMPGWFPTRKAVTGNRIRTETRLELDGLALVHANPQHVLLAGQPHRLTFFERMPDGSHIKHEYTPDLAVLMRNRAIAIVDFKHSRFRAMPEWQKLEPLIREAYRKDHGVNYVVLSEDVINVEPRNRNIRIMLRHENAEDDPGAHVAVRRAIRELGFPTTIDAVRHEADLPSPESSDRAFSVLMQMALRGEIALDMSRRFNGTTTITAGNLSRS